jgi:plastocyanin
MLCQSTAAAAAERAPASKPATHTIVIDGTKYAPETLTVRRGDTVVWINKDPFPHTVTAKGSFDSRAIAAGKSWKWTPRSAGDYAYICTLHPNMTGAVKVE